MPIQVQGGGAPVSHPNLSPEWPCLRRSPPLETGEPLSFDDRSADDRSAARSMLLVAACLSVPWVCCCQCVKACVHAFVCSCLRIDLPVCVHSSVQLEHWACGCVHSIIAPAAYPCFRGWLWPYGCRRVRGGRQRTQGSGIGSNRRCHALQLCFFALLSSLPVTSHPAISRLPMKGMFQA
jgi:hypothetical protein